MPKKTKMDQIEPLVDAITMHKNEYDSGDTDYSVTTLIDPPRVVHLNRRYLHGVTTYVFDNLASFVGTGVHDRFEYLLPKVPGKSYMCEQRLFTKVLNRKISGCFDILKLEHMWDVKTCSTWKYIKGDFNDWEAQQNMYRLLFFKRYKIELTELSIIAIFLDWTLYRMMQSGKDYPREKAVQIDLPIWEHDETHRYMQHRVQLMIDNENVADDDLPPCDHNEMWAEDDSYAVKRNDRQRALRVLPTLPEASEWMKDYVFHNPDKVKLSNLFVQPRLGKRRRCIDWCPVNVYCNQFHEYMKEVNLRDDKIQC